VTPVIGFIGIGRMGMPMCRNLLAKGHALVVHNRTPAKAEALAKEGATIAASVEELAPRCDVVITCLDTDLGIIAEAAHELGIQLPLVAAARGWVELAREHGLGERDIAALRLLYPGTPA
jgi:3-hydroxyisobutyrate dehydrogenase-like beta-hydroxyacid dehydrogenase